MDMDLPGFVCNLCPNPRPCQTVRNFINHQQTHYNRRNFSIRCPVKGCEHLVFPSYNAVSVHVNRYHSSSEASYKQATVQKNPSQQNITLLSDLVAAAKAQMDSGHEVECPFPGCKTRCTKVSLYENHRSRYHKNWREEYSSLQVSEGECSSQSHNPEPPISPQPALESGESCEPTDFFFVPSHDNFDELSDKDINIDNISGCERFIAEFYLMLEAKCCLPVSVVQIISDKLAILSDIVHRTFQNVLRKELQSENVPDEKAKTIVEKVLRNDPFFNTHHKCASGPSYTSNTLRKKHYKEFFDFITPVELNLSHDATEKDTLQYIPIRKTVESILKDSQVQIEVEKFFTREKNSTVLSDFTDGLAFNKEPYYKKEAIHLLLYQDGVGLTNPIGSARNMYKESNMYMTIGNLSPYLRSKTENHHLVIVCNEQHFKAYKMEAIYLHLLSDLKDLEINGVEFAGRKNVPVLLQFILGDNLGQHIVGGFEKSFNATYFCRYCNITKADFRASPSAVNALRTPEDFQLALEKISTDENIEKFEGVVSDCVFNCLSSYHCVKPGLPPCFGHDTLLGVVDYDLALYISHFVNTLHWFTYEQLNILISTFKYKGQDMNNKPAPVAKSGARLGGHAVQNWTLLRLLPLIIEDYVKDTSDEVWKLYLKLKTVMEYLSAPAYHLNQVGEMRILVAQYLTARSDQFPEENVKPKHHYVAHAADLTLEFGPLIHFSTLNFERKHQFFKSIVRMCHNFINVEKSMAWRHQWSFAYNTTKVASANVTVTDSVPFVENLLDTATAAVLSDYNFSSLAVQTKAVVCDGVNFTLNSCILLTSAGNILSIGRIKLIAVDGSNVVFVLDKYSANLNAFGLYEIDESKKSLISVSQAGLKVPVPHSVYLNSDKKNCISLKHLLVTDC